MAKTKNCKAQAIEVSENKTGFEKVMLCQPNERRRTATLVVFPSKLVRSTTYYMCYLLCTFPSSITILVKFRYTQKMHIYFTAKLA